MTHETEHPQPGDDPATAPPTNSSTSPSPEVPTTPLRRRSRKSEAIRLVALLLLMCLVAASPGGPALWKRYARRHPALEDLPGITYTSSGIHGDAINVALIGTKADIIKAMLQAKWYPADPITFRTSL